MSLIIRNLTIAALTMFSQTLFAQSVFTLKGTLSQLQDGTKIYLSYAKTGERRPHLDSTELKGHQFEMHVTTTVPVTGSVFMTKEVGHGGRDELNMIIAGGETLQINGKDSLKRAAISIDGKGNTLYRSYLKSVEVPVNRLSEAFQKVYSAGTTLEQYNQGMAKYMVLYNAEYPKKLKTGTQFVKDHPHDYISLIILNENLGSYIETERVEPAYNALDSVIRNSPVGLALKKRIGDASHLNLGTTAPLFTAAAPDGKDISLLSFRGKYVLIDFWASWCGPCRAENPVLLATYNKYKSRNFEVLGTSIDSEATRQAWLRAIKEDGMPWQQVIVGDQRSPIAKMYKISGIPMNFLLDPNGRIIGKNLRGDAVEAALEKYLK